MTKRLFIFAGFDADGIIDKSLLYYLQALSKLGDVIFNMDNDAPECELYKIHEIPNVLHAAATRHGEYDFGSYKRGYQWAADNNILENYDWVYLVNDSVYGPLRDLCPILEDLESRGADVTGMYYVENPVYGGQNMINHIQSWFLGMNRNVTQSKKLKNFMFNIKKQKSKDFIVLKYEIGMSEMFRNAGYKIECFKHGSDQDGCFLNPVGAIKFGIPFLKKSPIALANISKKQAKKLIANEIMNVIDNNMWRRNLYFGKYRIIWEFRLFGFIPIIGHYRMQIGAKSKTVLFAKITLFSVHF